MAVHDPELIEWNAQAAAFLALSPCDQELYIAAVNAGADRELLLDAFCRDGWLEALTASGIDPLELLFVLPPEAADMVVEAAIAASRAAKLMEQYNLDHAAVMLRDGIDDRITEKRAPREHHRIPRWYSILVIPVADLYDCESRLQENPETGRWYSEFLGLDNDVLVAAYVLDYLVNEIERLALRHRKVMGADRRAMNDFRLGAAHEIVSMLQRMAEEKDGAEDAATQNSDTRALVVVKRDLIREKYDVKYRTTSYRFRRSDSYQRGREAGAGVSIRSGVGNASKRRLGGD